MSNSAYKYIKRINNEEYEFINKCIKEVQKDFKKSRKEYLKQL